MAKLTEVQQVVADLKTATDEMAGEVDSVDSRLAAQTTLIEQLKDQIAKGGTITEADLDPLLAGLTPVREALKPLSDRLKAMGTDPNNPVAAR